MKTTLPIITALALAGTAFAGERVVTAKTYKAPETECFRAKELQLDMFGQYSVGEGPNHAGPIRDHGWGGGVGVNYFVTRNFGLGLDASWLAAQEPLFRRPTTPAAIRGANDSTTIHNFSGSLIYRFPIDRVCVAPYVYAGGGAAVDGLQWASAHGGAGIEWRVKPQKLGIFTDARYTYYGDRFGRSDLGNISARVGVRLVF